MCFPTPEEASSGLAVIPSAVLRDDECTEKLLLGAKGYAMNTALEKLA